MSLRCSYACIYGCFTLCNRYISGKLTFKYVVYELISHCVINIKMNQTIFVAVLVFTLGIASSFPLPNCDKLKDVKKGVDNHNQYLVKLNDSDNYRDAEYMINLVNQYQIILEQHASNVDKPSVSSQLALTENAGVLHGILSKQALLLVSKWSVYEYT